jgi:hypothetical protein
MVFVEHFPEVVIAAFEAADYFTMFWKLSEDWVMEVHGRNLPFGLGWDSVEDA